MQEVPLIPRSILFGNPDRAMVRLSPDGQQIGFLAPRDGVLNVWIAPRDQPEAARPVTHDTGRGIRYYGWAYTNRHIFYLQDEKGDENWRLYRIDLNTNEELNLTPFEGVQARPYPGSPKLPEELVVGLNNRAPEWHDLYRVNIATGERTLLLQHDQFMSFLIDDDYRVCIAQKMKPDGGLEILKPDAQAEWQVWDSIPAEDMMTYESVGLDCDAQFVFAKDSRGRDTAAVVARDLDSRATVLLAADERADAAELLCHPTLKHVQAVSFVHARKRWEVLDKKIADDMEILQNAAEGDLTIVSRDLEDRYWVVLDEVDVGPMRVYLYEREQRSVRFLFTYQKELENQPLAKLHSTVIKARDGLDLVVYHAVPIDRHADADGIPDRPVPMVLVPHGGPWSRDHWGFNAVLQWLANRGYAAMGVNFRTSTGFGKAHLNAGDLRWDRVIEDQEDAVRWAISKKIADPDKVAVMGGSFGGYSTLAGLTFTPELYACGVDIVGPSNLITLLESIPPYWKPILEMFTTRVGDHRTEEGRVLLKKRSPLTYADRISRPLLIGQGANDPRVKQAEADQIVEAMQAKSIPVAYVLYPDEGHGFARPENRRSFFAIAEAFLARCLGGRYEPIGNDFEKANFEVVTGVEEIPGLKEAIGNEKK